MRLAQTMIARARVVSDSSICKHQDWEVAMLKSAQLLLIILTLGIGAACSTQTKTVSTETREYPANEASNSVVEKKTETTTTESRDDSSGVLSSTVDVVGEVLSWPFRAVGGLFRGIF
jgi:hypothetical protein